MSNLKSIFKKIPLIHKLYVYFFKPQNIYSSEYWIKTYIPNKPLSVVQIGANDGVSGDPIHNLVKNNSYWNVLFVEPVLPIFKILKENYGNDLRFKFENAAINSDGLNQHFYIVDQDAYSKIPNLSEEYNQIGSFDENHISKLSNGQLKEFVVIIVFEYCNLDEVEKKNAIEFLSDSYYVFSFRINLFCIRKEILKNQDFEKLSPKLIGNYIT